MTASASHKQQAPSTTKTDKPAHPAAAQIVHYCVLIGAGILLLLASFLPWLNDPLGKADLAWRLPVDIGWQFHSPLLSYGLLCCGCALSSWYLAYARWQQRQSQRKITTTCVLVVGLCCLILPGLLLLQYLCADVAGIDLLAQHRVQMTLIQQHFGYKTSGSLLQIQPLSLSTATLGARLMVLINQLAIGPFCALAAAWLLLGYYSLQTRKRSSLLWKRHRRLILGLLCAGLLLLVRAPLATISDYEAKEALAAGSYTTAMNWLNFAAWLNPDLQDAAYFHIQRGQAWYFLSNGAVNDDIHAYLAYVYREQGDYLDAYQELEILRQGQHNPPAWVAEEIATALTRLAEITHRQATTPLKTANADTTIQPWLQALLKVDAENIYALYVLGRIQYDLHNYSSCVSQMAAVLQISPNRDVQSSAYTYIAFSMMKQGNLAEGRQLLLKALELDPNYHNNTAREELSGLH